jgi:hypothetical protein
LGQPEERQTVQRQTMSIKSPYITFQQFQKLRAALPKGDTSWATTIGKAAAIRGCSRMHVWRCCKRGDVPGAEFHPLGRWLIPVFAVRLIPMPRAMAKRKAKS